jgi:thiol-disulfide isomerase/thioredoxin
VIRSVSLLSTLLALVALASLPPCPSHAAEGPPTLEIGATAPDFDLPGIDGRRYTLASFSQAKVLVIIFTANHCPTAQAYEGRIARLDAEFRARGVEIVLVSPNDPLAVRLDEQAYSDLGDSFEEMKLRAKERGWTFPYLYDGETEAMSRKYGPAATPHVFVFDAQRKLRFVGRIDDDDNPAKAKTAETRDAIEALLAGKPVPVAKTKVFGCSIKWSDKRAWVKRGFEEWAREPVTLAPVDVAGVKALAQGDAKKLRLINVWATWCGPCVIEFPDLVTLNRIYRGRDFEVVTLNADDQDQKEKARAFLVEKQASMRNLSWTSDDPTGMIEALDPRWQGGLPYTMLVAPGGKVLLRSDGAFDMRELRRLIVDWLGRYYYSVPGGGAAAAKTGGN